MNKNLSVLITGASRGIGFALSEYFLKNAYTVFMIALHKNTLLEAKNKLMNLYSKASIHCFDLDVSDNHAVKQCVETILKNTPTIDILINSAGIMHLGGCQLTDEILSKEIDINLKGTANFCRQIAPIMQSQKRGHIFNFASKAGRHARSFTSAYSASKFAVHGYTQALYHELLPDNVNVTALYPSAIDTELMDNTGIPRAVMIPVQDIVKTIDFVLQLSNQSSIPEIDIHCKAIDQGLLNTPPKS